MEEEKEKEKKKKSVVLEVQNVKGTVTLSNIGDRKNGKKRT